MPEEFMTQHPLSKALIAAAFLMLTAACATTGPTTDPDYDPWESMNRSTYAFNKGVDKALYKPVSSAYIAVVPEQPRKGVSNAMRNLREPWTFVNDILQLKFKRAFRTLGRLTINSTLGIGGLFKVSDDMGIPHHSEDLGQTFAVWGIDDSPYLIIPFIGPSTAVDAVGFGAYIVADPVTLGIREVTDNYWNWVRTGMDALDARARNHGIINDIYDDPDGYEVMRSSYRQLRNYEIHDGNPPSEDGDIFDDLEDEEDEGSN
jgi:phospholipid-binding lipoprotein MlaA